jgi:hypothetical protein
LLEEERTEIRKRAEVLGFSLEARAIGVHRRLDTAQIVQAASAFEVEPQFVRFVRDALLERMQLLDAGVWRSANAHA